MEFIGRNGPTHRMYGTNCDQYTQATILSLDYRESEPAFALLVMLDIFILAAYILH